MNTLLVGAMYLLSTPSRPGLAALLPGARSSPGSLLTVLYSVGTIYLTRVVDGAGDTYGTFAVVIGLLTWLNLIGTVLVWSAELNSVLDRAPSRRSAVTLRPIGSCPCRTPSPHSTGPSPVTKRFNDTPEMGIDPSKRYTATMETSMGELVIALDAIKAPKTVNNFVFLSLYHYYDGVIFHRIIRNFVCQGGDPEGTGRGGPGYKFEDELPKPGQYEIGSLAMANAGPNTNGSQFFLISGPDGARPAAAVLRCSARSSRASRSSRRCRASPPIATTGRSRTW